MNAGHKETLDQAVERIFHYIDIQIESINADPSREYQRLSLDGLCNEIRGIKNLLMFIPEQADVCKELDRIIDSIKKMLYELGAKRI